MLAKGVLSSHWLLLLYLVNIFKCTNDQRNIKKHVSGNSGNCYHSYESFLIWTLLSPFFTHLEMRTTISHTQTEHTFAVVGQIVGNRTTTSISHKNRWSVYIYIYSSESGCSLFATMFVIFSPIPCADFSHSPAHLFVETCLLLYTEISMSVVG